MGILSAPGRPALPYRDLLILLPPGRRALAAEVIPVGEIAVLPVGDTTPCGPLLSTEGRPGGATDATATGDDAPASWGELTGQAVWHGMGLATVRIHPERLHRAAAGDGWDRRETAADFTIRLQLAADTSHRAERRRVRSPEADQPLAQVARLVANPETRDAYATPIALTGDRMAGDAFVPTLVPSLDGPVVDMVIITTDELAPTFQQLPITRPRAASRRSSGRCRGSRRTTRRARTCRRRSARS
ncbi:MAG: hypothetical protein C0395_02280 [Gemmatimonas sp.]|nr:hypothetical protein [Gemmatimonas sp.]